MAPGPCDGDPVQGDSSGEHGRRAVGEESGLRAAGAVRQPIPHKRVRARAGPLFS